MKASNAWSSVAVGTTKSVPGRASGLQALHRARTLGDLTVPGWRVHALHLFDPVRHSLWVNGPWRITFEWIDGDAYRVDLEQYH